MIDKAIKISVFINNLVKFNLTRTNEAKNIKL